MRHATIPDAFRAAVTAHPDRLALRDEDRSVTYCAFDAASNGVARVALIGSRKYFDRVAPVVDDLLPRLDAGGHRTDVELAAFHTDLLREPAVAALAHVLDGLLVPDPS